jgi:beta-xylosidase
VQRLIGFTRVDLEPGQAAEVRFTVPADLASFTSRSGVRVVEPGELVLGAGRSSADLPFTHAVRLTGATRVVDHTRRLHPVVAVEVEPAASGTLAAV